MSGTVSRSNAKNVGVNCTPSAAPTFVRSTPVALSSAAATPAQSGSSSRLVPVQKYLHDLERWSQVPVEEQENIIGWHKLSDIEQPDSVKKPYARNVLTSIEENGEQLQIVRDNMPFGEVGKGEFGACFIGYARSPPADRGKCWRVCSLATRQAPTITCSISAAQ